MDEYTIVYSTMCEKNDSIYCVHISKLNKNSGDR